MQPVHGVEASSLLVANDDAYTMTPNNTLSVAKPGLYANDTVVGSETLVVIDSPPTSGTITLHTSNWSATIVDDTYPMIDDGTGQFTAPANVNGHLAVAYVSSDNQLIYRRSIDVAGKNWGTPIAVASDAFTLDEQTSLQVVNGKPAIVYISADTTGQPTLNFVKAQDTTGTEWKAPITIAEYSNCNSCDIDIASLVFSFSLVNGKPVVAYNNLFTISFGTDPYHQMRIVSAVDVNGDNWASSKGIGDLNTGTIQTSENFAADVSLTEVDGEPALSYSVAGELYYARITTNPFTGSVVGNLAAIGEGEHSSLAVINGKPAIVYYKNSSIEYVRADDVKGDSWPAAMIVAEGGNTPVLWLINGLPTIQFFSEGFWHIPASDNNGTAWEIPERVNVPLLNISSAAASSVSDKFVFSVYEIGLKQLEVLSPFSTPNSNGSFYYTPNTDFCGLDAFTYHLAANAATSNIATVEIDIACPILHADSDVIAAMINQPIELTAKILQNDQITASNPSIIITDTQITGTLSNWSIYTVDADMTGTEKTSLAIINGDPAIAYIANNELRYVRANNTEGTVWDNPVYIANAAKFHRQLGSPSLASINDAPAIAFEYQASFYSTAYIQALDGNGAIWGETQEFGISWTPYLTSIAGKPSIASVKWLGDLYNPSSGINFTRLEDTNGTDWSGRFVVSNWRSPKENLSLAVVNGKPAVAYLSANIPYYVQAVDSTGASWNAQMLLDEMVPEFSSLSELAFVNGRPALSYYNLSTQKLQFLLAADADGSAWKNPIEVGDSIDDVSFTALVVANGLPTIVYFDETRSQLRYVEALDANGASWADPSTILDSEDVGTGWSVLTIDGRVAISFVDQSTGSLKYVRQGGHSTLGGSLIYTPPTNFCGTVEFDYYLADSITSSNVATVTIEIACTIPRVYLPILTR